MSRALHSPTPSASTAASINDNSGGCQLSSGSSAHNTAASAVQDPPAGGTPPAPARDGTPFSPTRSAAQASRIRKAAQREEAGAAEDLRALCVGLSGEEIDSAAGVMLSPIIPHLYIKEDIIYVM